ncbi:MAG: GHKL domain-containing protein [Bacillota bacterium]|nr:GHKL domain-containing protein [Bacillota bacterium]
MHMEIVVVIIVFILLNLVLWGLFLPYFINKKVASFQNDLVDKHYEEVENMYRTMRTWKHDYHNHVQAMEAYISLGQMEELKEYLKDMHAELTEMEVLLHTGNVKADAILNSKIVLMKSYDILVDVTAIVPENIPIKGTELSVLIGNLLDNAMEACLRIDDKSARFVRIYIDILKGQLYICVTNSMAGKARRMGNIFISMKGGSHGFGLGSVDKIVRKYGGYINRQTEEGVFATEIMLPLA